MRNYLSHLQNTFNVTAISETWLNAKKGMDVDGYELNPEERENKGGGFMFR